MIFSISLFFIVADVPARHTFYRDMLGFEVTFRGPALMMNFSGCSNFPSIKTAASLPICCSKYAKGV